METHTHTHTHTHIYNCHMPDMSGLQWQVETERGSRGNISNCFLPGTVNSVHIEKQQVDFFWSKVKLFVGKNKIYSMLSKGLDVDLSCSDVIYIVSIDQMNEWNLTVTNHPR